MDEWVGEWMGCDILLTSIFFFFRYVNKQIVLITNMVQKVIYDFCCKSYNRFAFKVRENLV